MILQKQIAYLNTVLSDESIAAGHHQGRDAGDQAAKYADERRTEITALPDEIDMLDVIQEEDTVVTLTHFGYCKAHCAVSTYRAQKRGGKGVLGAATRDEDFVDRHVRDHHARDAACSSPTAGACTS